MFYQYTEHGHCGVLHEIHAANLDVDNDKTLMLLRSKI